MIALCDWKNKTVIMWLRRQQNWLNSMQEVDDQYLCDCTQTQNPTCRSPTGLWNVLQMFAVFRCTPMFAVFRAVLVRGKVHCHGQMSYGKQGSTVMAR